MSFAPAVARQCEIEIAGPPDAPVIAILGGISSSRHVAPTAANPAEGWWSEVVGPRRGVDTLRFRVVSVDYIDDAGSGADLSTYDQAVALCGALDESGIGRLHALVGASYGGMVGLAFAALFPERIDRLVVISAAHESSPAATIHHVVQRQVVELGWRAGLGTEAVVIARAAATSTYTSALELSRRFAHADPHDRLGAIEQALVHAGERFAARCTAARFYALSRSLDLHSVDPALVTCDTTLIGVNQDLLVPPRQLRELASRLGGPCTIELVDSIYGHDAFLEDHSVIAPIIHQALTKPERETT